MGARPRRRCGWCAVGWKCRHDALVMRLLLRQDATDEGAGVLVRRGGGSLDLKCPCFNVDHRPGDQVCPERRVPTFCSIFSAKDPL